MGAENTSYHSGSNENKQHLNWESGSRNEAEDIPLEIFRSLGFGANESENAQIRTISSSLAY